MIRVPACIGDPYEHAEFDERKFENCPATRIYYPCPIISGEYIISKWIANGLVIREQKTKMSDIRVIDDTWPPYIPYKHQKLYLPNCREIYTKAPGALFKNLHKVPNLEMVFIVQSFFRNKYITSHNP